MKSSGLKATALGAGVLVALAACSGSGATSSSSTTSSDPIHLGLMADYTGAQSYLGPDMESGVRTALAEINAAGGILGRQVDLSTGDTVGDPVDAIPAFRKLVSTNHIIASIGPTSNSGPALLPIAQSLTLPMFLQGGTTALDHNTNPFFFRTTVGDGSLGKAMAAFAIKKQLMKAAFAFTSSTSAQTLVDPIKAAYTAKGGTVVANVQLVPAASSYRSQIQQIMATKPDVVFIQQDPQTAATFFQEASELGFDNQTTWVGTDTEMSHYVFEALGPKLATTNFFFAHGGTVNDPAVAVFNAAYLKQTGKSQPLTFAPESYDATLILALAIDKAKTTDGAAVSKAVLEVSKPSAGAVNVYSYSDGLAALAKGQTINYDGVASTDDFDQYHNVAGPFVVSSWTTAGSLQDVMSLTPADLG